MNAPNNAAPAKIFTPVITALVLIFALSSCATKAPFLSSPVVPAAEGMVTVKEDKNDNYVINIQIQNLAKPENLHPPRNVYVVWMESDNNFAKNIGQINSSTGFLSKKLKAGFQTVSAVKPTQIYITAENYAGIQSPEGEIVLSTRNF
ncbi:MAG TPA: hypothetical protein VE870_15885 [Bacteroidales bacterium]|nr:hypothetical protein [Bacteroidales bacterium]